ncbi:hypothetical protein J1614_004476 [Plenodomus biglobosus]|nr:hypothetical protein J1614_004476 [Plenodomus biglobosus]
MKEPNPEHHLLFQKRQPSARYKSVGCHKVHGHDSRLCSTSPSLCSHEPTTASTHSTQNYTAFGFKKRTMVCTRWDVSGFPSYLTCITCQCSVLLLWAYPGHWQPAFPRQNAAQMLATWCSDMWNKTSKRHGIISDRVVSSLTERCATVSG